MRNAFCQRLRGNRQAVEVKNMRLTSLYLCNLGPIVFGFAIVGLQNPVTPLESLRIRAAFLYYEYDSQPCPGLNLVEMRDNRVDSLCCVFCGASL